MQTRSQQYSKLVYEQILPLKEAIDNEQGDKKKAKEKAAKQYGSLCHNFPLMVLHSGLSQSVAFVWVKSKGKPESPYGQFLKHLATLLESENSADPAAFQHEINGLDLVKYQRQTRKVLAASIWYKRFAESILNVKPGDSTGDEEVNNASD